MYRALRSSSTARVATHAATRAAVRQTGFSAASRRLASTSAAPAAKSTWKGTAVRWGVALGAVYWYNTSPIFADESNQIITDPPEVTPADLPTIDAVLEDKRKQDVLIAEKETAAKAEAVATKGSDSDAKSTAAGAATGEPLGDAQSPEALEEEAGQQGAFNPETGEINWDCPCLGGMAHGPCGEEFRSAFSCFVFSEVDPKGMDCIDKFQHMQDCFRQYPEIYGAELQADDEEGQQPGIEGAAAAAPSEPSDATSAPAKIETAVETTKEAASATKEAVKTAAPAVAAAVAEEAPKVAEAAAAAVETAVSKAAPETAVSKAAPETAVSKAAPETASKEQIHGGDDGFDDTSLPKAAFDATAGKK